MFTPHARNAKAVSRVHLETSAAPVDPNTRALG